VDRLHDHDNVVVTLPRGHYLVPTSFTARILAVEGMTVALEVENRAETARLTERVPNAFLTFRHGDTLVGFRGTLHAAHPVGDFRFVVADQSGSNPGAATGVDRDGRVAVWCTRAVRWITAKRAVCGTS
jgi:hypothetical protein